MSDKYFLLTLLVSTVDKNIINNSNLLNLPYCDHFKLIVVNQMIKDDSPLLSFNDFCKVINSKTTGLSKSRNIALSSVNNGLAIFVDDDVTFEQNLYETIFRNYICLPDTDVFTFKINSIDTAKPFKNYSNISYYHNMFSLMKVSSIEVCFNVEKILNSGVVFDERFGLGSKFPSGEENIFLTDLHKKGYLIKYIPEYIVSHPYESTGKILTYELFYGKGALFRRIFKMKGLLFSILFILKKHNLIRKSELTVYKCFKFIIKGYFVNYE